jgi:hypothetical protein
LCHVSPNVSNPSIVSSSWQERKREASYTLRPTLTTPLQPRSLNGEKSIQRLQSNHITSYFALGFVLIFFREASYPQVDGIMVKVNGVDQSINLAISFAQDEITPIQGYRWIRKALIALEHLFPRKRLQIGSLSRILHHGAIHLALGTT